MGDAVGPPSRACNLEGDSQKDLSRKEAFGYGPLRFPPKRIGSKRVAFETKREAGF